MLGPEKEGRGFQGKAAGPSRKSASSSRGKAVSKPKKTAFGRGAPNRKPTQPPHKSKPKAPSPGRRWRPKRSVNNPYDDELGGVGDTPDAETNSPVAMQRQPVPGVQQQPIPGLQQQPIPGLQQQPIPGLQQQQQYGGGNNNHNVDDDEQHAYMLFKEQQRVKAEADEQEREMAILEDMKKKMEEIEMKAVLSREGRERKRGPIPGLEHRAAEQLTRPSAIPSLVYTEANAPLPSIPGLAPGVSLMRPEDDLEYQEYKLFKQQELVRKQREDRGKSNASRKASS